MKRKNRKIAWILSIFMLMTSIVIPDVTAVHAKAQQAVTLAPDGTDYLTANELANISSSYAMGGDEEIKMFWGKQDQTAEKQKWYVIGGDDATGNSINDEIVLWCDFMQPFTHSIFASLEGVDSETYTKPFDASTNVHFVGVAPERVAASCYGTSAVRDKLVNLSTDTACFTAGEQDKMVAPRVYSYEDTAESKCYYTEDKLYLPTFYGDETMYFGRNSANSIASGLTLKSNRSKYAEKCPYWIWLRTNKNQSRYSSYKYAEIYEFKMDGGISGAPGDPIDIDSSGRPHLVLPVCHIAINDIAFASTLEPETANIQEAMTLRFKGSNKVYSYPTLTASDSLTVTYDAKDTNAFLMIQGKLPNGEKLSYARSLSETITLEPSDVASDLVSFEDLKIWVEQKAADGLVYISDECSHSSVTASSICNICGKNLCDHSFISGVCEKCGYHCPHETFVDGVCEYCEFVCTHTKFLDAACMLCGYVCEHSSFTGGACDTCDYVCSHAKYQDGICEECGYVCSHAKYQDGICEVCGYVCSHEDFLNGTCAKCGYVCEHSSFTDGACDTCDYVCSHENFDNGICTECKYECSHDSMINGKCEACGYECQHTSFTNGECDVCDYVCSHENFDNGICTECKYECSHDSIINGKCEVCGIPCPHTEMMDEICVKCGYVCEHTSFKHGLCEVCGHICDHPNFVGGSCEVCGAHMSCYLDLDGKLVEILPATEVTEDTIELGKEGETSWYIVNEDVTINSRIVVTGDVNLILADGITMNAKEGIRVTGENNAFTIWAQSVGDTAGKLNATGKENNRYDGYAGIGGDCEVKGTYDGTSAVIGENITINGGNIYARGFLGAGIGSSDGGRISIGRNITINGGHVIAEGDNGGAGIGGGSMDYYGTNKSICDGITVNGGIVEAFGSSHAAGIGAGYSNKCAVAKNITINGGVVTAMGGDTAAGIGSGYTTYHGYNDSGLHNLLITGGSVTAIGNNDCPGVGGIYSYGNPDLDNRSLEVSGVHGFKITGGSLYANNMDGAPEEQMKQYQDTTLFPLLQPIRPTNADGQKLECLEIQFPYANKLLSFDASVNTAGKNLTTNYDGKIYIWLPKEETDFTMPALGNIVLEDGYYYSISGSVLKTAKLTEKNNYSLNQNYSLAANCTLTIADNVTLTIPSENTLTISGSLNVGGKIVNDGKIVLDGGYHEDLDWISSDMKGTVSITGGYYSFDPKAYVAKGYDVFLDGSYYLVRKVKAGDTFTVSGLKYKVLDASKKTVALIGASDTSVAGITVPVSVAYLGDTYKVSTLDANALKAYAKLTNIIVQNQISVSGTFKSGVTVTITKGTHTNIKWIASSKAKVVIIGGSFLSDPSSYVKAGYKVKKSNSYYVVTAVKAGDTFTVSSLKYKVLNVSKKTVAFYGTASTSATSMTIPATVSIGKQTYKVTAINANSFKSCKKLKTITIKSTTIATVQTNAFAGLGKGVTIKVPKAKLSAYKRLFKNAKLNANVSVVAY